MNAPLLPAQVAAMDDTMSMPVQRLAAYVAPTAYQRNTFSEYERVVGQRLRHTDSLTKCEAILAAFRQPADEALNHGQLTAILERVLALFESVGDSTHDCNYTPVTDALEAATVALGNVYSTWGDK